MSIRLPLQGVLAKTTTLELGAGSVAGGIPLTFTIPQDTDNVVVKFKASVVGAYSATLQTTDDGGTTWYDVARTSIVSNANNDIAEWISVSTNGSGVNPQVISTVNAGSVLGGTIGSAAASALGSRQVSGLPLLSQLGRVFIRITGNVTSAAANSFTAEVKVNSQSPTA